MEGEAEQFFDDLGEDGEQIDEVERVLGELSAALPSNLCTTVVPVLRMTALRSLELKGSKLEFRMNDELVSSLCQSLSDVGIILESLLLPFNDLTDISCEIISKTLLRPRERDPQSLFVENLSLEGNSITHVGVTHLQLQSNKLCPLLSLNLSGNSLGLAGGMQIATAMKTNRSLRALILNSCGFPLNALIAIATALGEDVIKKKPVLEVLEIDRAIVGSSKGEESTDHFSRILLNKTNSLSDVSLKFHSISDFGARVLADALSRNSNIISINLECNSIGVSGAEALSSYLILQSKGASVGAGGGYSNSLRSLRLSYNCIGDEGAIALAEALCVNTSLLTLTLNNNAIGVSGLVALGNALYKNNSLRRLAIFGNEFDSDVSGRLFFEFIQERLRFLDLSLDISVYIVDGVYLIAEK